MAKRRNSKSKFDKNIFFIFLIVLLLLVYLSVLSDGFGLLGKISKNISFKLVGLGSYIIYPLMIINLALFVANKFNKKGLRSFIFIYTSFLLLLVVIDINMETPLNLSRKIQSNLAYANLGTGVGLIGSLISFALTTLIGKWGSYLFLTISLLLSILSIADLEVKDFFQQLLHILQSVSIRLKNFISKRIEKLQANRQGSSSTKINGKNQSQTRQAASSSNEGNESANPVLKIEDYKDTAKSDTQLSVEDYKINIDSSSTYKFPPLELLTKSEANKSSSNNEIIRKNADIIESTLASFNIEADVVQVNRGPRVTSYELQPAGGVKVSSIVNLQDNLALSLATPGIRIEAPIPGKSAVGIEVPNKVEDSVSFGEIVRSKEFAKNDYKIPFALGKDIAGNSTVTGVEKMPHLLIAGATGSGKSVCINTLIMSILYSKTPEEVKLILIDPKMVELSVYNGIPHLVIPVVTDPKKASAALNWAVREMERRYDIFSKKGVRDIEGYKTNYNQEKDENLSYIVIIIDELSDLMMVAANDVENYISRLAQMSRACGIHLVIATQRPSVDVITGTIKANIPSRISFSVSSQIDSRTILDVVGAEKLLGKGDMLFYPSSHMKPKRLQGAYISDDEVENIVQYIKDHSDQDYNQEVIEEIKKEKSDRRAIDDQDELLKEAIDLVISEGQASVSLIQRKLHVGYARAGRIIDQMESLGVIEGHKGSKPREVLVSRNILREEESNEHS